MKCCYEVGVNEHVFRPKASPQDWIASWLQGLQEREGQTYPCEPTGWQALSRCKSYWVSARLGGHSGPESIEGTVEIQTQRSRPSNSQVQWPSGSPFSFSLVLLLEDSLWCPCWLKLTLPCACMAYESELPHSAKTLISVRF